MRNENLNPSPAPLTGTPKRPHAPHTTPPRPTPPKTAERTHGRPSATRRNTAQPRATPRPPAQNELPPIGNTQSAIGNAPPPPAPRPLCLGGTFLPRVRPAASTAS